MKIRSESQIRAEIYGPASGWAKKAETLLKAHPNLKLEVQFHIGDLGSKMFLAAVTDEISFRSPGLGRGQSPAEALNQALYEAEKAIESNPKAGRP